MEIDSTFWVAVSFLIFFGVLIYLKVPQKVNEILNKLIQDIKNELDESEKLRTEARELLNNAQIFNRMMFFQLLFNLVVGLLQIS